MSRRFHALSLSLSLAALGLGGCELGMPETDGIEQIALRIAVVPMDVRCVRITAAGPGRTMVREIEATAGEMLTRSLSGLPLGPVTVLGEAFPAACSAVTKSTIPAWVSEPVDVSIVLGRSVTVDLAMVRNGRAKVDVSWSDEPTCSAGGLACQSNAECCSRSCVQHACAAVGDGGTSEDGGGAI
jgi:hypothetical protein